MNDIYQLPALNRTIDALHLDDDRHAAQITAARLIAEQLDYSDKPTATHKEHPMGKPQEQPDMIHTGDTHYEQARAHRIAHDLLTAAAQALMHGTPPHYPRLNRADPYSDAVTATILHQLATTTTTTKEEQ